MTSFTDLFPDSAILDVLGDDIEHLKASGGTPEIMKGEFEMKYLDEEVGDRIDIIYPVVELNNADATKIKRDDRIRVSGTVYKILKKRPIAVGKTQVVLRSS